MRGSVIEIIKQAASELGLPVPDEALASQDESALQLLSLLNAAGYELSMAFNWEQLNKIGEISTTAGEQNYQLPADFARLINQTMWSTASMLEPVVGPISPQQWQTMVNGGLGTGVTECFRILGNSVVLLPAPAENNQLYNFEYQSTAWVQSYLVSTTFTSTIQNDQDIPLFDFFLLVKFLKLKMWQAKGLNTTALEVDFTRMFDSITSGNKGASILSLSNSVGHRYISVCNVPDGNWRT